MPFLALLRQESRRLIHATKFIESGNATLRKIF